ncbi:extracellular solute-binding protein [Paenibacillus hemerocallicola]|uniref:Extracellular solute-binding protein n=1 Tax=Paenibacillus hemerocallicola TaxID=1172614 RepID=A0A5C4SX75_9BACL|nr:extracellular solute-binding protein [Paenibacillus hemerocallicola]TNJ60339.1 extracellular solute-binding protein [Paenibacillus hemerocallicola]
MRKKGLTLLPLMLTTALIFTACGKSGTTSDTAANSPETAAKKEPVTLKFFLASKSSMTTDELKAMYEAPIQRKYPHISLEFINNDKGIDAFMATGTKVDFIFGSFQVLSNLKSYDLFGDMSDLVKKHKYDTGRFEPTYLEAITGMSDGKLSGFPFYDLRLALYYNKDLFDRFGVPYPKDGMTWEQLLDTAKRLTREDGGVLYRGFAGGPSNFVAVNQFSLGLVDPKTNQAALQKDQWKSFLDALVPLYQMPGYSPTKKLLAVNDQSNLFFNEKTAAMLVAFSNGAPLANKSNLNWDLVSLPEMKGLPGVGSQPYPVYLTLSSNSEHRDDTFLAITQLVSDEVQMERSADMAHLTPLKNAEVKAAYGKNVSDWKGKNIAGVVNQKTASPMPYSPYNITGQTEMTNAMLAVIVGEKDANTALREAEEQTNKKIQAAAGK